MKKIAANRNYRLIKRAGMYEDEQHGDKVYFYALHRKVVVAIIQFKYGGWRGVIMAVPGDNHETEVPSAIEAGDYTELDDDKARCLYGGAIEDIEKEQDKQEEKWNLYDEAP